MKHGHATASTYHPWRMLRTDWAHVELEHTDDIPCGRLADTNGIDHIRMRRRLYQVERRCALAHELIHLERGNTGECSPALQAEASREAARWLIPWEQLLAAVRWSRGESELADELWVTVPILRARTGALRAVELMEIAFAVHDAHYIMPGDE
ncbi:MULTISPECIES: ImmA/IrrE family metallo-endopeptidase [Brachybacterium]|uniref:IrrE N-terminal-like domain-containing protein n=2 Tax=Brachybacterium alimentarium TaxID=47845 RepID=A0A2A3YEW2_9MICO|nr:MULTISPECIES: ImmA/IrrE family metallo-endopeptidase [Brachybacterium]PCC30707.1 hypothetical protein CIK71_17260 [Brachybacterium alimentarium]PCC37789.1 hypothetical protein CIK66_17480 [Brachybacterium alimentarium]RCS63816.1 ImmA/IrrE family metallo-endopeptidase [Brachybacterium sp. JB7]RCS64488.1 ImmA/IrrE family metallo-endopeptidase [Brachybacterium alimentarium]RCS69301.1 ImmA/IrrE family metallo-endopeptidase [Brachybacterium alimentarium]